MSVSSSIEEQFQEIERSLQLERSQVEDVLSVCSTISFERDFILGDQFGDNFIANNNIIAKRRKLNSTEDKYYLEPLFQVPQEGFPVEEAGLPVDSFVFHELEEQEYFNPLRLVEYEDEDSVTEADPLEVYKSGLLVDKLSGVKRLTDPKRWCVLPLVETTVVEVPLVVQEQKHSYKVTQELGHVAWYKAVYYVDRFLYESQEVEVQVDQVFKKFRKPSAVPYWKPNRRLPWNAKEFDKVEIPPTVFCTDKEVLKKFKFLRGPEPSIVHQKRVALNSLYNIWAGDKNKNGRPFWKTGPDFNSEKFFQCYCSPYCDGVAENPIELETAEV
jgi:hypothetical protein